MFRSETRKSHSRTAWALLELIFHAAVRNVRKTHGNAIIGLLLNIFQTVLMVGVFYMMSELMGMRGNAARGDFILYLLSGVFMFMTHTKTLGAVSGAEGPTSPMMKHSPMNPIISIAAAALSALYIQVLSGGVVLFVYHAAITPITINEPGGVLAMMLLSWAAGIGIGMIFLSARPWWPEGIGLMSTIYQRANMIASGKMFLANAMPTSILKMFDWNPLFHTIDQTRGFTFLNYHPHYSNIEYPIKVTLVCLMIGLMGEFYTRKFASASWSAGK
ncbi:MAG: ABC transporter permease [Paracoccaceae bacterium]